MLRAILLDLDDTLLRNDMATFIPSYLDLLGTYAASIVPKEQLTAALLASTRAMFTNTDSELTNRDVFWADFEQRTGLSRQVHEAYFGRFYVEVFPSLRPLTGPVPDAHAMVTECLARQWQVVIATNPVFPQAAIIERLRWAGLDPDLTPFSLVTSYENMHATKPHAAYYREILTHLACEPGEALMVGNDLDADILPARAAGINTFHVTSAPGRLDRPSPGSGFGTLRDLRKAFANGWHAQTRSRFGP